MVSPPVFIRSVLIIYIFFCMFCFLWFAFCFVCLRPVSCCVPNVASFSEMFIPDCAFRWLWRIFVLYLVYLMLPVSVDCPFLSPLRFSLKFMYHNYMTNAYSWWIRVITKLSNSEQSYKGKVKTHKYIDRQNQSTTGKMWKP